MTLPEIAWSDIIQMCEGSFQRIVLDYKHMWSKIRKNPSVQHLSLKIQKYRLSTDFFLYFREYRFESVFCLYKFAQTKYRLRSVFFRVQTIVCTHFKQTQT